MSNNKILYCISKIDKAVSFEWIYEELHDKHDLYFILLNPADSALERYLRVRNASVYRLKIKSKVCYPLVFFHLLYLLIKIRPLVIHAHLFEACILGLLSAKITGVPKRIYTRHHSTFHHDYHPRAVKYDRWINWLATDIIAISENVKRILMTKEGVKSSKIHLIHHGFKLELFNNVTQNRIELLRNKYKIDSRKKVVGVISRYIKWKGYDYMIPAFGRLASKYPDMHFVFANAQGPDKEHISSLLNKHLPPASYTEIAFEEDLFALYHLFNVFVHVPINREVEAFGQIYIEALAAGIPSVFTLSGVAPEFIEDNFNAVTVSYCNEKNIYTAINRILKDNDLRLKLKINGSVSIQNFKLEIFIQRLSKLYNNEILY